MLFPIASGNWNDAAKAGVFYRNWNNNRSNDNNNIGFRAADYIAASDLKFRTGNTGEIGMAPSCILAKSAGFGFLVPRHCQGNTSHA
jgi:hypothetical protein